MGHGCRRNPTHSGRDLLCRTVCSPSGQPGDGRDQSTWTACGDRLHFFFLHALFYLLINYLLVAACPWILAVDPVAFFPILHADADPLLLGRRAGTELQLHVFHITLYFATIDAAGYGVGVLSGLAIEKQVPWFKTLARHPWLYNISGAGLDLPRGKTFIYVSALSKIQADGQIILYEGNLSNIYVKADGTISYMTLTRASSSVVALPTRPPVSVSERAEGIPFSPGGIQSGPPWPLQQNTNVHRSERHHSDMLFLTGAEINNFYLERRIVADISKLTSARVNELVRIARESYRTLSSAAAAGTSQSDN